MVKLVLPPGFRFHPTDEELVRIYLKRKVCGQKTNFEPIGEVELYNYEPWDLREKSFLQTRDLEWYFFIPRDRKYPNGSRTNRATEKGYWKSTGKDRAISSGSRTVGTKKTLIYYNGRAPKGDRTNWVMHEYRLTDAECQRVNAVENGFVLCRIYEKSGAGPKNGEQYGAPVEDIDFEDSPAVEGDGSGFFESGLFETGSSSGGVYCDPSPTSSSRVDTGSHEVNKVDPQFLSAGIQPCNLKFPDLLGKLTSDPFKMEDVTNHYDMGNTVLPTYGLKDSVSPFVLGEDELVQELYKLVESSAHDQLESAEKYEDPTFCLETGSHQPGAHPPSDGDFLELNDLLPFSECEDGIEVLQSQTNGRLKGFLGESLLQLQGVPSIVLADCSDQWQDLHFGDGMQEKQQNMPESVPMQSSVSAVTYDSQYQPTSLDGLISSSDFYNEEVNAACQTQSVEPDVDYVVKLFERAKEDKSFDVESFAENIQRELFPSEDNSLLHAQEGWDGQYYDAPLSFADFDMYGESGSTAMNTASNFGMPQRTLVQASLASKVDGVLDKLIVDGIDSAEHFEGIVGPHDFVAESFLLSSGDVITSAEAKNPPSPLSILWSCLDSLPTLPASAADLSPKAVSPGRSIRVTAATGVGVGAVSVTCTSVADDAPSSPCTNGSVAEVKDTGRFGKLTSFVGQRSKPSDKWRIGYYTAAIFGGFGAVFWLLMGGDVSKLLRGLYRRMVGS